MVGGRGKGNGPIKPGHPPGGPGASLSSLAQSQAGSRNSPLVDEQGAVKNLGRAEVQGPPYVHWLRARLEVKTAPLLMSKVL